MTKVPRDRVRTLKQRLAQAPGKTMGSYDSKHHRGIKHLQNSQPGTSV